jgi:hypothetical protein
LRCDVLTARASVDGKTIDFEMFATAIRGMFEKRMRQDDEIYGTGKWELGDGGCTRVYGVGGSFGENSIIYGVPLIAEMTAIGKTEASLTGGEDAEAAASVTLVVSCAMSREGRAYVALPQRPSVLDRHQVLRLDSKDYLSVLEGSGVNGDLGAKVPVAEISHCLIARTLLEAERL